MNKFKQKKNLSQSNMKKLKKVKKRKINVSKPK